MRTNVFKSDYCNSEWIVKHSNFHQSEHDEQYLAFMFCRNEYISLHLK